MGILGERGIYRAWARLGLLVGSILAFLALIVPAQPALATFHLVSISEVYPGSVAHPDSSFIELQMYDEGQNFVGNHAIVLLDSTGNPTGTFTFPSDLPGNGTNQQAMLVGDDDVEATFGVKPDLVDADFNLSASGGAACWAESIDCVSWGDFEGSTPSPAGIPADGSGIPDGVAIARRTSGGACSNLLDEADDTNDSDDDFVDAPPVPQNYTTVPAPPACTPPAPTPATLLDSKPASFTKSTDAVFAFHSNPAGASFECRLDRLSFQDCDSGSVTYAGPLSEGTHNFRVRASNANGAGAPVSFVWTVDLTAPVANITSHPLDPSPGQSASFRYGSNEGGSKFECRLSPLEAAFTPCDTQPKVYSSLADGDYEFEVRAIDRAGNVQPAATAFLWTVDNALLDTTPPDTAILSKPPDPSASPVAVFTYSSNEPGSRFQCKLDTGNFNSCPSSGTSYTGLSSGPHSFQVRAIDASNNVDPTPAGYSFSIVLGDASLTATAAAPNGRAPAAAKPNTTISKQAARTHDRTPTFRFASSRSGATFQCKLDGGPFKTCRSPLTTKTLSYGQHILRVRALSAGIADPSPAVIKFTVARK
jgi:hypothetical protein